MHKTLSFIGGASLGAGLMFILDPDRGKRRRALIRDKSVRWSRKTRAMAGSTSRDLRNRVKGMTASWKSWVKPDHPVSDQRLLERVRSKLGMVSRHSAAIEVSIDNGVVTLRGPVLQDEVEGIISAISRIQGVVRIENRLQPHQMSDIPALLGAGQRRQGSRFAFFQSHWSPTARLFSALMGTAALLYGLRQRTAGASTLAASGLGLLIRSATNREFARIFGFRESMGRTG
jgi:hypothetical protein